MKTILTISFFFFLSLGMQLQAQNVEQSLNFDKIIPGLSEHNVREIVGQPFRIEPYISIKNGTNDTTRYWIYSDMHTVAFKNHYVDYVMKDRVMFLKNLQELADPKNKNGSRIVYVK